MLEIYVVALIFIIAVSYLLFIGLNSYEQDSKKKKRINGLLSGDQQAEEYSIFSKIARAFTRSVELFVTVYLKPDAKNTLANDLFLAGKRSKNALTEFYIKRFTICLAFVAGALAIKLTLLPTILAGYIGFMIPKFDLDKVRQTRQKKIRQSFPLSLDMLVIGLEAGYNLDKSLGSAVRNLETLTGRGNIMAEEYKVLINELHLGLDSQVAWNNLYKRTQIEEIKQFITAVLQSEKMGATLASTLRNLSLFLIKRKKQELETVAAAMGAKMALPLAIFILPVILGFVAGPFIQDIMNSNVLFGGK